MGFDFEDEDKEKKDESQEIKDTLEGGIKSTNIKEYRNTYFIREKDSFDDSYPMYVYFSIVDDMTKIISIKLSFWLMPYRVYCDNSGDDSIGITEEDNSPTVGFQISSDNGLTYGSILGKYADDLEDLELKDYIEESGNYIMRFTTSARGRLSVQLEVKLDIKAR